MNRHVLIFRSWLFLLMLSAILSGCATFEIKDYVIEPVADTKIPIRMGLYLSEQFRDFQAGEQQLGKGMTKGAIQATKLAFDVVVMVDSINSNQESRVDVKYIIKPEIVRAGLVKNEPSFSLCQFIYKWTITTSEGNVVYTNTIRGEGSDDTFVGKTRIENCLTKAAKDQYQKYLLHMYSSKWWEVIR